MATFVKFNSFVEAVMKEKHNFGTDTLKVMLTNTSPSPSNAVKADITEIAAGNGYPAGGLAITTTSAVQTSGVFKLVLVDSTFMASGGSFAAARWAVVYNDSAPSKELISYFDYGSSFTLPDGEPLVVDYNESAGFFTLA
ncbi:hypothetical protein [Xanthobacter versatilis]|uniref:Uncharacterized protein n=1 Tax=Xanthobacter autotrophicus (strain ATCC BAA-1158 / Py2) TaxID=78245 RepID=A7ILQ5_XANP2|nr:conserved hypothetical protein [Xanthobacter autotrophicus Py2]